MDLVKGSQKILVVCITGTFLMKLYSFFQEKIVEVSFCLSFMMIHHFLFRFGEILRFTFCTDDVFGSPVRLGPGIPQVPFILSARDLRSDGGQT